MGKENKDSYIEPLEQMQETYEILLENPLEFDLSSCKIDISKPTRRSYVSMLICVGGSLSAKEIIYPRISNDPWDSLFSVDGKRVFQQYELHSVDKPYPLVNATAQINMNLVGFVDAKVLYLAFEDLEDYEKWKLDTPNPDYLSGSSLKQSSEFDFFEYMKPLLYKKLICIFSKTDKDQEKIQKKFIEDLKLDKSRLYITTYKDLAISVKNLYDCLYHEIPEYLIYGIYNLFIEFTDLELPVSSKESALFIDSMIPVPFVEKTEDPNYEMVSPLLVSQTPVTRTLYNLVMGIENKFKNDSEGFYSVKDVSWADAIKFCNTLSNLQGLKPYYLYKGDSDFKNVDSKFLWDIESDDSANGYRLLTETEFIFSAAGNRKFQYSGSDYLDNTRSNKAIFKKIFTVAQRYPNSFGIYDCSRDMEWLFGSSFQSEYKLATTGYSRNKTKDLTLSFSYFFLKNLMTFRICRTVKV